jgi:hypothetical protein
VRFMGAKRRGEGVVDVTYVRPRKEGKERKRARGCEFSLAVFFLFFVHSCACGGRQGEVNLADAERPEQLVPIRPGFDMNHRMTIIRNLDSSVRLPPSPTLPQRTNLGAQIRS